MTDQHDTEVTLTLTGQRAERGIALADLESFVDAFVAALRDYDRARRGEETRKSGAPDRRASAASAFRLLRLEPGSAVATLLAEHVDEREGDLGIGDPPLALATLAALAADVAAEREISDDVLDALDRARRACGEDGAIEVVLPDAVAPEGGPVVVDRARIERLSRPRAESSEAIESISGRLYSVNLEPDRLAIRSSDGVEWACRYDEHLEPRIRGLLGEVVWAAGRGRLTAPLKGTMRVERIERAVHGRQTELFVAERPALDELLARQGVAGPQGLDALADSEWVGDESDERYLAALSGEA